MKAKRLRALLVAGLLSLAPAVTLTSCGGGGGGGGGSDTGNSLNDDGGNVTLNDIVGKTLIVELSNGTQQIRFGENGVATGIWLSASSQGATVECRGKYGISSYSNAAIAEAEFTYPAKESWKLYYLVEDGELKPTHVIFSTNGETRRYTNCRFQ